MGSSWGWGSHAAGVGRHRWRDLQGGWSTGVVKNPPANAGDAGDSGSIPGSGRSPGGGNGNPLQYSFFFFFHSSILAWRIPWTEEPGRLQSMES